MGEARGVGPGGEVGGGGNFCVRGIPFYSGGQTKGVTAKMCSVRTKEVKNKESKLRILFFEAMS